MRTLLFLCLVAVGAACGTTSTGPDASTSTGGGGGGSVGGGGGGGSVDAGTDAGVQDAGTGSDAGSIDGARVFDLDVLHEISITVAMADLDTLDNDQNVRVACTVTVDGETVPDAGCRKKGQTSLRPLSGKPGFTIKFNEFVPGQKIDGLKRLTLDNAVQDPSLLTGHVSYEVFRRAGLPAPRTAHATLRFNGEDKGLYVVEEPTNGDYLETAFGDGSGNLYEGPWDFPKGSATADLKDEVSEMRSRADLEALTRVVMDSSPMQLESALTPLLDVDQFLTNYAVESVAALWDNYSVVAWNYYWYHVPNGRFVILTHGVNWPYWHADFDPFDLFTYPWGSMNDPPGYLCVRLRELPTVDAKYRAEVKRVARDAFDVAVLTARINLMQTMLRSRALTGQSAADRMTAEANADDARNFVRDRRAWLANLLGL
ncbi:MAG: CotH kinase family protein [Archangium sp.]